MEAFFEPLIQLLADAGVHARFLLGNQIAQPYPFIDILRLIKSYLTFLNRLPRFVDVVLQTGVNL